MGRIRQGVSDRGSRAKTGQRTWCRASDGAARAQATRPRPRTCDSAKRGRARCPTERVGRVTDDVAVTHCPRHNIMGSPSHSSTPEPQPRDRAFVPRDHAGPLRGARAHAPHTDIGRGVPPVGRAAHRAGALRRLGRRRCASGADHGVTTRMWQRWCAKPPRRIGRDLRRRASAVARIDSLGDWRYLDAWSVRRPTVTLVSDPGKRSLPLDHWLAA